MSDDVKRQITRLSDVELVRMATTEASSHSPQELAVAESEAHARELPIDEAFLPADDAASTTPGERFEIAGIAVICPHCRHGSFERRHALLNTRVMTLLRLDWLNQEANALVCQKCGLIQFFTGKAELAEGS